jgi:hypothetical protein
MKGHFGSINKMRSEVLRELLKLSGSPSQSETKQNHLFKKIENNFPLVASYRDNWYECVSFNICDAAQQVDKYMDSQGKDITHIYSYNKVMSKSDRRGISQILNRTNFKLMAWYFGPRESA